MHTLVEKMDELAFAKESSIETAEKGAKCWKVWAKFKKISTILKIFFRTACDCVQLSRTINY